METCRAAVPRSRRWTDANTVSRLRRSVALQGIGQRWQPAVATLIDGDLEGCGPSQPRWTDAKPFHGYDAVKSARHISPAGQMSLAWLTCAILAFRLGKPRPCTANHEPLENPTPLLAHPL